MKSKPRILVKHLTDKDKITNLVLKDTVGKLSRSGYIAFPKELIGKYVEVTLKVIK